MINHPLEELFKNEGKGIRVYMGKETIDDPYEKNVIFTYFNPTPIRALVSDLTAAQAQWKMPGISVSKVKEIYVQKKHRTLIEKSAKIEIDGEAYCGWRENGKMQIREEGKYLRLYIYIKHT